MINSRIELPCGLVRCCLVAYGVLSIPFRSSAEDPIIVHYSDPTLTRMETEIKITPAQKDRFEDIVVKYRDPLTNPDADTSSPQRKGRGGRHGGDQESNQGEFGVSSQGDTKATPRRTGMKVPREELDELATILTPAQIKKFQDLNSATRKKRHDSQ
jgi:Spy/CpxP family protein refolding chaperone